METKSYFSDEPSETSLVTLDVEFALRLKSIMEQKNLTVSNLAGLVGVTFVTAQRWTKGTLPRPTMLGQLANKLNVSIQELTGRGSHSAPLLGDLSLPEQKLQRIKMLQRIVKQGKEAEEEILQLKRDLVRDIENMV